MPSIKIDIDDRALLRGLARLRAQMGNLTPVFADIGEYLIRETDNRFRDQKAPDGSPWQDLKPATWKRKKNRKILTERTRLRGSLAYQAGPDRVEVGTNVVYGAIHQFGGKAGRGGSAEIPTRPFLGINDADRREIGEIVQDYLRRAWGG